MTPYAVCPDNRGEALNHRGQQGERFVIDFDCH